MLPSRPPTEALGSFFLTCGGLVFIFSTEEVTLAAMRRGRDGKYCGTCETPQIQLGLNQFVPRCHDVSQFIRGHHLRCILLDSLHGWVQRMA